MREREREIYIYIYMYIYVVLEVVHRGRERSRSRYHSMLNQCARVIAARTYPTSSEVCERRYGSWEVPEQCWSWGGAHASGRYPSPAWEVPNAHSRRGGVRSPRFTRISGWTVLGTACPIPTEVNLEGGHWQSLAVSWRHLQSVGGQILRRARTLVLA